MRYDVLLVNALKDQEQAEMIVRRLKALKFKVRHDKKRDHTTPTPRDYRDADNSRTVVVLWSEASCDTSSKDSDWVHALAHHARSKDSVLVQVGLDKTVPDDPFSNDSRYMLNGLTARKTVAGYYEFVDDLGARNGRHDLGMWIDFKPSDKDSKNAWKNSHPDDPLALIGTSKAKKSTTPVTAPAATLSTSGTSEVTKSSPAPQATAALLPETEDNSIGWWMIAGILAGILAMLFFGWLLRKQADAPVPENAVIMTQQCPAGQMPAYLLEPSAIVDDTSE
ncbi:MAG: hypothetical protein AAGG45_01240 [Pseudomonadota bacterium]